MQILLFVPDNKESLSIVNGLVNEIEGLRSIYLGSLSLSYQAEVMTPMILNASKQNKPKHPGVKLSIIHTFKIQKRNY